MLKRNKIARIDLWAQMAATSQRERMDGYILKTANPSDLHFAAGEQDAEKHIPKALSGILSKVKGYCVSRV